MPDFAPAVSASIKRCLAARLSEDLLVIADRGTGPTDEAPPDVIADRGTGPIGEAPPDVIADRGTGPIGAALRDASDAGRFVLDLR